MRQLRHRLVEDKGERRYNPPPVSTVPRFDGTITLGSVLSCIAIVITLLSGFKSLSDRFTVIETKVNAMWIDYTIVHKDRNEK